MFRFLFTQENLQTCDVGTNMSEKWGDIIVI